MVITHNWKIETWDAVVSNQEMFNQHNLGEDELNELKIATDELASKLLPQIEELGQIKTKFTRKINTWRI